MELKSNLLKAQLILSKDQSKVSGKESDFLNGVLLTICKTIGGNKINAAGLLKNNPVERIIQSMEKTR